jgi:hypothetical protein
MGTIGSAIKTSSINTVAANTQAQASTNTAIGVQVDDTIDRLNATRNEINTPPSDGEHTLKEINLAQTQTDINLSQTEFVVYDGEISYNNIELGSVRSRLAAKEATLAAEEAKAEIKTSINANGEAEFVTYSGMKIVTDTNKGGHTTKVYNPAGEQLMQIEGDPHVNMLKDADGNNGYDFHFGDDSTLKFEDGTELTFNTTETGEDTGIFYTTGVYVRAGNNVMHTGEETGGGARRADIAKVEADSYSGKGETAKGAVTMGLKGDGQILMQSGEKWNEIKDESWDGYLEDKTFTNQKGAAVDFKPAEFADLGALRSEILALQDKESGHVNSIAALTPQRSAAEGNLSAANSAYENFSAMEDAEFVDNDESRFNIEQKDLSLNQRANALGLFLSDSPLVTPDDFSSLGVTEGNMLNDRVQSDRMQRQNNITYQTGTFEGSGLNELSDNNSSTNNLVNSLRSLVDSGGFEASSLQNDAATTTDTAATPAATPAATTTAATTTATTAAATTTASADITDEVQIDFGDITKDQAKELYDTNLADLKKFEGQQSVAMELNTDAGKISTAALNTDIELGRHVVEELERQFGFEKPEGRYAETMTLANSNKTILSDLEAQMNVASSIDTDAGRLSAATLRTEIATTKSMIGFWTEAANFWKP